MKIRELDWNLAADRQAFIELPWQLYPAGSWVPPLKASLAQELSPQNLFFRHGRAKIWLAEHAGQVVGRIVASVDEQLAESDVGHLGYFECHDNAETATALLNVAEAWLEAQGKETVHGPVNLSIYNAYRLQTSGFETRPFLGEPRALPYYAGLLEQAGYSPLARWNSWDILAPALLALQGYMEHKAPELPTGLHQRSLADGDKSSFLADLHQIAMLTFAENYGFASLDFEEFLQVYQGLLGIFQKHPGLLRLFYDQGGPVGFGFIYPDYAPFFQQANGDHGSLAEFGAAAATGMVFHTFGIATDWRHSPLPYAMFAQGIREVAGHEHSYAIGGLAKEGRTAYDQLGKPSRGYAVYTKRLP